jgi:propanol-preferring alcohol dehydrogenase
LISAEGLDPAIACILPCSGLTAFSAIKRAETRANEHTVIIGLGGVGMMALQIARQLLPSTIICVDIDDKKLSIAKTTGADYIFNSKTNSKVYYFILGFRISLSQRLWKILWH